MKCPSRRLCLIKNLILLAAALLCIVIALLLRGGGSPQAPDGSEAGEPATCFLCAERPC